MVSIICMVCAVNIEVQRVNKRTDPTIHRGVGLLQV